MRTPFGTMFKALHDAKVNVCIVGMITRFVEKIIATFSDKENAFHIGRKMIKLTPYDIAVTFGLPTHGKLIALQPGAKMEKTESEFRETEFNGKSKLNKAIICEALTRTIK